MDKKERYSKKLLVFFVVFFVVIAFLSIYGAEHYDGHDETIELENYCKISDSDLIKDNHNTYVYYITWNGSPVGDAGSWAIYKFMESNGINISGSFKESKSMNDYEYKSIYGLIFTQNHYNITYHNIKTIVVPIYLYGENITDKTNVTAGLQTLKGEVPTSIYNEIKIYTTEAIVDGLSISSDNITNISHINSVTLITGPSGAYIINGHIVNPGDFISSNKTALPPGTILKDINDKNSGITDGMEGLEATIKDVQ